MSNTQQNEKCGNWLYLQYVIGRNKHACPYVFVTKWWLCLISVCYSMSVCLNVPHKNGYVSSPRFRLLYICLVFPRVVFVLIMYCTLSHILGHVTSSANGQPYKIKINKDFFMRFLKRGETTFGF